MNHEFRVTRKEMRSYDSFMTFIGVVGPLFIVPQVLRVWSGQTEGISLFTWTALGVVSMLWLLYGILRREKAIVVTNVILIVLNFAVVAGVLWN